MEVLIQKYKSSLHIYTDLSFIQLQAESQVGSRRSSLLCTITYNLDLFRSNRNLHKYKKVLSDHIHFFQVSPTKPQHAETIKVLPMGEGTFSYCISVSRFPKRYANPAQIARERKWLGV
jgi:hypothetical protein